MEKWRQRDKHSAVSGQEWTNGDPWGIMVSVNQNKKIALPHSFIFCRVNTETGESLDDIFDRKLKEHERCGQFWWGFESATFSGGSKFREKLNNFVSASRSDAEMNATPGKSLPTGPLVIFAKTKNKEAREVDRNPPVLRELTTARDLFTNRPLPVPEGVVVRARQEKRKALLCEPILFDDDFMNPNIEPVFMWKYLNFGSKTRLAKQDTTQIIELNSKIDESQAPKNPHAFRPCLVARLVSPYVALLP